MKDVRVLKWDSIKKEIEESNRDLYLVLDEAAGALRPEGLDVVFGVSFKFGESIFEQNSINWASEQNTDFKFEENVDASNRHRIRDLFRAELSSAGDFPLSLIRRGDVEIYVRNHYRYGTDRDTYDYVFPLAHLGQSKLMGVFGANDIITASQPDELRYACVSGTKCLYPILPELKSGEQAWRDFVINTKRRYGIQGADTFEFVCELFQKYGLTDSYETELLIIPSVWYNRQGAMLLRLQKYLLGIGWAQSARSRTLYKLDSKLKKTSNDYAFKQKHIHVIGYFVEYLKSVYRNELPVLKIMSEDNASSELKRFIAKLRVEMGEEKVNYYPYFLHFNDFGIDKSRYGIVPSLIPPFEVYVGTIESSGLLHADILYFFKHDSHFKENAIPGLLHYGVPSTNMSKYLNGNISDFLAKRHIFPFGGVYKKSRYLVAILLMS